MRGQMVCRNRMMQTVLKYLPLAFTLLLLTGAVRMVAQQNDSVHEHRLPTVLVESSKHHLDASAPLRMLGLTDYLRLGVTDIADALNRLAGVTLRDYGGAGGMKTVSVRGFGAQHTGVSYDGVMLSEIQSGEIDVSRYAIDNVQSLTLTIGDGDDIFVTARQATTPAVLSIQTLNTLPVDNKPHATAQLRLGSWGYTNAFVRYTQRIGQKVALTATADYVYADNDYPFRLRNGNITTIEHRTNSRMNSGHAELSALWMPNYRNSLWLKTYYYDNNRQLPGLVQYYTNVCGQRLHDRNWFAQGRWLYKPSQRLALRMIGKVNWASSAYTDTLLPDRRDDATYQQREYYGSVSGLYTIGYGLSANYALDYYYNSLNSTLATDRRPYRHTLLQTAAIKYKNSRFVALARLLWTACYNGAHKGESQDDMRRWSPSLSLSYKLLSEEDLYLRASMKDIFRVPSFNECYFHHYGSTDIRPENTRQYNIGVTWSHRWNTKIATYITADSYINSVSDKIVAVPYNMFIWRTVNMAKVHGTGIDGEARVEWTLSEKHRIDIAAAYTYQRIANRTNPESPHYGKQIPYQPLNQGSASVGWTNPWVCLSLHGQASGGRWTTTNHYKGTRVSGYVDMGLTAYRNLKVGQTLVQLRADIENMLNHQYEIVANYPMPRIHWRMGVKVEI